MASAMSPNRSRGGPQPRCRLPTAGRIALVATAWLTLAASGRASDHGSTDPEAAPSFVNDVVPLLTKAGCNAGACHAKAGTGQNGFRLSLLGFEPEEDHEQIVTAARGRRIDRAAPDGSLLVQKATAAVPHRGGQRLAADSAGHDLLVRWIAAGAPPPRADEPRLTSLTVAPAEVVLRAGGAAALAVEAGFSDGSRRDVSALALYESADAGRVSVDESGTIRAIGPVGRSAIMVRYGGMVSVSSALVPRDGPAPVYPEPRTFVDRHVFATLARLGIPVADECADATFLRRVSLDLTGSLPTPEQARAFLSSTAADRRDRLVDELLASAEHADFFAGKWTALLKNRRDETSDITGTFAFHAWVRDSFLTNKPFDRFVRELLAATGSVVGNPPVAWYKRVRDPKTQAEDVAQLFLGVRLQCAQCHHHPFERWSQTDHLAFTAFFAQVGRRPSGIRGEDLIFHRRGSAAAVHPRSGASIPPAPLGGPVPTITPDDDPRLALAAWITAPDNPWFARALANRTWKHFLGRGLVEPEDDLRETNPASDPLLLDALAADFVAGGHDLRRLYRTIVTSRVYQLAGRAAVAEADQGFAAYRPRRLSAEVLLDAIDRVTGSRTGFANLPAGTRAIALPDNSYTQSSPFLRVFGRPDNASVCECERNDTPSFTQSLHMLNAAGIRTKLTAADGWAARAAADARPTSALVHELTLTALSREPRPEEVLLAGTFVDAPAPSGADPATVRRERFEDLVWALLDTKEFLFNH
ncbi:MAG: DUF1549 and DUF1553 domain-containing protein [Pirellulales bacterium]